MRRAGLVLAILLCGDLFVSAQEGVELVRGGRPTATIVLPEEHEHLDFAVRELNEHLKLATGCELPVATEKDAVSGNVLLLGESSLTRELGVREDDLPSEGFVIKTFPGKLVIVGDTEHDIDGYKQKTEGNLWAVYHLLEEALGIRWYLPGPMGTIIPKTENLSVRLSVADAPAFPIRVAVPPMNRWNLKSAYKNIKLPPGGRNAQTFSLRSRQYNAYGDLQSNHTMGYWGDLYHESHPEYFAIKSDGTRCIRPPLKGRTGKASYKRWHGYLNYASEAVLKQQIQNHIDWYEGKNEELIEVWTRFLRNRCPNDFRIPFTPNDGLMLDQSEKSRKLYEISHEDDPFGVGSDYIFQFAHKFAWAMHKRFPEKKVVALAYSKYTLPPKTVRDFPPSFIIQIAIMQPIAHWKEDHIYKEWMGHAKEWHRRTGNKIHFWQYSCWPKIGAPFFWPGVWQKWYRELRDVALGAFINGGPPGGNVGRHHLNLYFGRKVLWNPDYDIDAGLREYAEKMYGPAKGEMYEFFKILRRQWEDVKWNLPARQRQPTSDMLYGKNGTYPPEVTKKLRALLSAAAAKPGLQEIEKKRIDWIAADFKTFFEEAERFHAGITPHNYALKLAAAPTIDGDLSDAVWQDTPTLFMERYTSDATPSPVRSLVKVGWTGEAVCMAIDNLEPHMDKVNKTDCVDIFLDVLANRADHYQLTVDATGGTSFRRFDSGYEDTTWKPGGLALKSRKLEDRWTVELKLPFDAMNAPKAEPPIWVWNVFRRRAADPRRAIALAPTFAESVKVKEGYPDLLFVRRPKHFYHAFPDGFAESGGGSSWHAEKRKTLRLHDVVQLTNKAGRRHFRFRTEAFSQADRRFHATIQARLYGESTGPIVVTQDTTFEMKIRWTAGVQALVRVTGSAKSPGDAKGRYFHADLFKGDGKGKWLILSQKYDGFVFQDKVAVTTGDTINGFGIYLSVPTGEECEGDIEYALIGEKTGLCVKQAAWREKP